MLESGDRGRTRRPIKTDRQDVHHGRQDLLPNVLTDDRDGTPRSSTRYDKSIATDLKTEPWRAKFFDSEDRSIRTPRPPSEPEFFVTGVKISSLTRQPRSWSPKIAFSYPKTPRSPEHRVLLPGCQVRRYPDPPGDQTPNPRETKIFRTQMCDPKPYFYNMTLSTIAY